MDGSGPSQQSNQNKMDQSFTDNELETLFAAKPPGAWGSQAGISGNNQDVALAPVPKESSTMSGLPVMSKNDRSKQTVLSGTVQRVLQWSLQSPSSQIFETIGVYVSDWDDGMRHHRVLLLRQPRGPVIKVITFDQQKPPVPPCVAGTYLRVIGCIVKGNLLRAFRVSRSCEVDYLRFERMEHISERAINTFK